VIVVEGITKARFLLIGVVGSHQPLIAGAWATSCYL
jgi:hypothetical protein